MPNTQEQKTNTPWTILWKREDPQGQTPQEKINNRIANRKKLKVLPYVFTGLTFCLIFIFSNQFKNLGADLFTSDGENTRFGMPVNNIFWDSDKDKEKTQTGETADSSEETETGSLLDEETTNESQADSLTEEVETVETVVPLEIEEEEEESDLITTPQIVDIAPVAKEVEVVEVSNPFANLPNSVNENTHTSAPAENETLNLNSIIDNTIQENNLPANNSGFKENTHTYDKVEPATQTPATDVNIDKYKQLHESAQNAQQSSTPQPTQNVQSGPAENFVFLLSLFVSSLAWLGMRKIKLN